MDEIQGKGVQECFRVSGKKLEKVKLLFYI